MEPATAWADACLPIPHARRFRARDPRTSPHGHDAIRSAIAAFYAIPGLTLHWQATKVEAARSGDMGCSMGTYEMSFAGPDGNPATDHGKYVTIWRKQDDGTWKVVADIFNSDLPAPEM